MRNLSELLESIKMDLGVYGINLPLEDADDKIYRVIQLKTIKTYSQYFPLEEIFELNVDKVDTLRHTSNGGVVVKIPDWFNGRRIVTIRDVEPSRAVGYNGFHYPDMSVGLDFVQGSMLAAAQANMLSSIMPPFTFKYENPNLLHVYNYQHYSKQLIITAGIEHYDNLSSIPNSQWDSFEKLALLDVKAFLYGVLKHHTDFSTQVGNISLKIDDWANAAEERKNLLAEWDEVYHLEGKSIYFA